MLSSEIKIRVRYGEVDRMGYLHHGNYALYFEQGRTELMRALGLSYRQMEDDGILLPLREMNIRYFLPALYDDEVIVKTSLHKLPSAKLEFHYEMKNSKGELLSEADTVLVFVDSSSRKPMRAPRFFMELISEYF